MTPFDIPTACYHADVVKDEKIRGHVFYAVIGDPITTEPAIFKYINEIANIDDNWDGHGAIKPNVSTLSHVKAFLKNLEKELFSKINEDNMIVNPHGTVTIRIAANRNYLNIEFGESFANYYAMIDGEIKYRGENVKILQSYIPNDIKVATAKLVS